MDNKGKFARDGDRDYTQKRKTLIEINYLETNPYSVLISQGKTKVLCSATTGNWMPPHVRNSRKGWIGAQYSMLPSSCPERVRRERNNVQGRTREIERMIGRSLRSVCSLENLPNESIIVDCDVIQADGGTRCASITGGFVALYLLLKDLQSKAVIMHMPASNFIAGISAGMVRGAALLDLNSSEDMSAQVDLNLIMSESGRIAELQATGEESTFKKSQLNTLIELATEGIKGQIEEQKRALGLA